MEHTNLNFSRFGIILLEYTNKKLRYGSDKVQIDMLNYIIYLFSIIYVFFDATICQSFRHECNHIFVFLTESGRDIIN